MLTVVLVYLVCALLLILVFLIALRRKDKEKVLFNYNVHILPKGSTMPLELTITNEQKVKVTLKPVTLHGTSAPLDGKPAWTVADAGTSTVVPSDDGLSAELVSSDTPGDTVFLVTADADLGEGVENVSDTITLHVAGAHAASLGLVAADPELK